MRVKHKYQSTGINTNRGMQKRRASGQGMGPGKCRGKEQENSMRYHREALHHLIVRALRRNTFTAHEDIEVLLMGEDVLLYGTVSHPDLIPEAVATVEAVASFLRVYSHLSVLGESVRA